MNAFVYNVQVKREKWLTPQIVYLTPQIHAWAVMLTPNFPALYWALYTTKSHSQQLQQCGSYGYIAEQ